MRNWSAVQRGRSAKRRQKTGNKLRQFLFAHVRIDEAVGLAGEGLVIGPRLLVTVPDATGQRVERRCQRFQRSYRCETHCRQFGSEGRGSHDADPFEAIVGKDTRAHPAPHRGGNIVGRLAERKILRPGKHVTQETRSGERIVLVRLDHEAAADGGAQWLAVHFHGKRQHAKEAGDACVVAYMHLRGEFGIEISRVKKDRLEIGLERRRRRILAPAQNALEHRGDGRNICFGDRADFRHRT